MRTGLILASTAAAVALTTLAFAQADVIKQREAVMKMNGRSAGVVFQMAGGRIPFDAAVAADAMKAIQTSMANFPSLFPPGSDQGDTKALPAIWEDMADFTAHSVQLIEAAKAVEVAAAGGIDAIKPTLGALGGACQSCHEKFREGGDE